MIAVIEWDAWAFLGVITLLAIIWIILEATTASKESDDDEDEHSDG